MPHLTRRRFNTLLVAGAAIAAVGVPAAHASEPKKIVFLVNGNLGDKSYFDLGALGMNQIKAKYGDAVETKVIEMGTDQTKWLATFQDASEGDWDVIVGCTFEISDIMVEIAPQYPDKTYILIDGVVPFDEGKFGNVYSVTFKQNEGSYLAGILAAGLIADGTIPADWGKSIGFLGGMDIPVINDFLVGYIEGARSVTPDIKVAIAYAGSFNDAAKGKELALAQYRGGTAIGFNVAGLTGLGQLAAAKEAGRLALGVNSDQEAIFKDSDPEMASKVASSMLKKVDVTLLRAFDLYIAGTLPVGQTESIGLKEDAVGLVETGNMATLAKDPLKARIAAAKAGIVDGSITVSSGFVVSQADLNTLRDSVRP
ncbi:BMP family ABC transporter substrate-binding protein [Kaistia dalseonensis]|uniref:Basic membrane protein A n=1 Tax=Kaistia dalseonensis TaxID=410840 RepID=A0ABU0H440_9HYPH|nr:BMP family ABC transporter substrate-binding protein [Kaistia dalseonensis]MCX5494495.1 BMP family ABC transporter substrate-binding protein [Kaistia dalseonensis]MDQ0437074.1 basic membrane protein A [Kaistia dalseonensis]